MADSRFNPSRADDAYFGESPALSWTTTALFAAVRRGTLSQPDIDGHYRATRITSALARLAERGIAPDPMIRRWLGPILARHVMGIAASLWLECQSGSLRRTTIDTSMQGWLHLIDQDCDGADGQLDLGRVMTLARNGITRARSRTWLDEAAIAHIIDWRIEGYVAVELDAQERELLGGSEATTWVAERFSVVHPEEWEPSSVVWELAYINDPDIVAENCGVPREVLDERILDTTQLTRAAFRRIWLGAPSRVDGQTKDEMFETVVGHLERLRFEAALAVADRWVEVMPTDIECRNIAAFCLLPLNPAQARSRLLQIESTMTEALEEDQINATLIKINLACSYLMSQGGDDEDAAAQARTALSTVAPDTTGEHPAYLWLPWEPRPRVGWLTVSDWLEQFENSAADKLGSLGDGKDQLQRIEG